MRRIWHLAVKDLRLLTRDRAGLFWVLGWPFVMALFFGTVMGGGGGGRSAMPIAMVDEDSTDASRAFAAVIESSSAVRVTPMAREAAHEAVRKGERTAFVLVPKGYGADSNPFGGEQSTITVGIDPSRQAEAGMLQGVVSQASFARMQNLFGEPAAMREMIDDSMVDLDSAAGLAPGQKQAIEQFLGSLGTLVDSTGGMPAGAGGGMQGPEIDVVAITREEIGRPRSAFEVTFPSAVMWGLIACASSFAVSIVLERTEGTLLRLRTSPLSRSEILAGKGVACLTAGLLVTVTLLAVGRLVFGIRLGQMGHLALAVFSAAFCFVGLMMLLSVLGKTPRAVGGASWGTLLIMAMLGGGMIPLIAMPQWMQTASNVSPVKWGVLALEGAIWRGFTLPEMLVPCGVLVAVGAVGFAVGVRMLSWAGDVTR